MDKRFLLALIVTLLILDSVVARQQPASPAQDVPRTEKQQQDAGKRQDDVVRISVTLVQIDVGVTDGKGRPVTDLKPGDFEVYEDGRRQQITTFSRVLPKAAATPEAHPAGKPAEVKGVPAPPAKLRPDQVRRTIALVVDDLTLTFETAAYVRQALKKFVDEQVQPGDLVTIIRTGAGMGALQMFTADKNILYAAVDRVRWSPNSTKLYTFAPWQPMR